MLRFFDNNISNKNIVKPGFFPIENDTDTKKKQSFVLYARKMLSISKKKFK